MSESDCPDNELWFSVFNGAITTHIIADPAATAFPVSPGSASSRNIKLAFALKVTFTRSLWPFNSLSSASLPPLHFHPRQSEYVRVLQGVLVVEIEGQLHRLSAVSSSHSNTDPGSPGQSDTGAVWNTASDTVEIQPWAAHRLYPPADFGGFEEIVFLLTGSEPDSTGPGESVRARRLDAMFFENWYAYQEDVWRRGSTLKTLQVMAMFDAGGSYLCVPSWVPFGQSCAVALGVVLGRCVGGILGYQPYYREWTSDWDDACRRMRGCIWWRRFVT